MVREIFIVQYIVCLGEREKKKLMVLSTMEVYTAVQTLVSYFCLITWECFKQEEETIAFKLSTTSDLVHKLYK